MSGPRGASEALGELPSRWLTVEQNEWLAAQHAGGRTPVRDAEAVVDSCASSRMIEIFAAMLPIEWG